MIAIGVSGVAGSFSEEAAVAYAKRMNMHPKLIYLVDMEGVLSKVESKEIDLGIFPVVNLRGGLVKPALLAMGKHLFTPIDEFWLDVQQCLLVLPGTLRNSINKIASHQQALLQCQNYLTKEFSAVELIEWIDTAKAAEDLKQGILSSDTAVIAPKTSAELYQLDVLASNIQDNQPNLTAFIIVKAFNE